MSGHSHSLPHPPPHPRASHASAHASSHDPSTVSTSSTASTLSSHSDHRSSHRSESPSPTAHSQRSPLPADSRPFDEPSSSSSSSSSTSSSSSAHPSASGSESDNEGTSGYRKGGYHPVLIGDIYLNGRYTIEKKLGWGHFSTVWLASDHTLPPSHPHHFVAIKVQKSAAQYTEAAEDEIKLLTHAALGLKRKQPLHSAPTPPSHVGRHHVISLLHHFTITGPNGRHVALVFECLGDNLLSLIKRYDYQGVPIRIVKLITRQVLLGLDYLHRVCGIIHTDLKPENFLLLGELYDAETVTREREEVVRRRKEKEREQAQAQGQAGTASALSASKKLSKGQKKRMKAKAKKLALKGDAAQAAMVERAEDEDEDAEDEASTPVTSPSPVSVSSLSSASMAPFTLPASSSTASTVGSSSFSSNSFASSASSNSFPSSSFQSPSFLATPQSPKLPASGGGGEERRMSQSVQLPSAASHLDSMLAAFSAMSLSSPSLRSPLTPFPFLTKICDLGNGQACRLTHTSPLPCLLIRCRRSSTLLLSSACVRRRVAAGPTSTSPMT